MSQTIENKIKRQIELYKDIQQSDGTPVGKMIAYAVIEELEELLK